MFCKKSVLKSLVKFRGKHLCRSLFLNKVSGFGPATLLKKNFDTVVSLWILPDISEHLFLQNISVVACKNKRVWWYNSYSSKYGASNKIIVGIISMTKITKSLIQTSFWGWGRRRLSKKQWKPGNGYKKN